MGLFKKTLKWNYEIAPMYMEVKSKPLTAKSQSFFVLCGLSSETVFSGDRIPQVGELLSLPSFSSKHQVTTIRKSVIDLGPRYTPPTVIYFDPAQIAEEPYWTIKIGQMRPLDKWRWQTGLNPEDYAAFGYEPSDWKNPKLKYAERKYVLSWKRSGQKLIAPDGRSFTRLDPIHSYLKDWFPDVAEHLEKITWRDRFE